MAGLLDFFTSDDPAEQAARMQMAQGLLSGQGSSISRLAGGMGAYQQAMAQAKKEEEIRRAREQQAQMQMLQQQMLQQQMQQQQARAEAEKAQAMKQQGVEGAYRNALRTPDQVAMMLNGGPTRNAAQAAPGMQPMVDQQALIRGLRDVDPIAAFQMAQPKPDELMSVAPGATVLNKRDPTRPVFTAPTAPKEMNPNQPFMVIDGKIVPNEAYQAFELNKARAGGTRVDVNTGQRGLDNTLKLRGDFRSEPIYKAHQDVLSAHAQITTALKQASPAGDLAGATKLMKILDPGSVVRESELGMAMAASGAMDRLSNYANMVVTGQKLTPTQRKDFQALSDALAAESSRLYAAKRKEYSGIVQRNGLNEDDVLGPAGNVSGGGWSMERVGP